MFPPSICQACRLTHPLSLLRESEMEFVDDLTDNSQVFDVFHGAVLPSSTTFDTPISPRASPFMCDDTKLIPAKA